MRGGCSQHLQPGCNQGWELLIRISRTRVQPIKGVWGNGLEGVGKAGGIFQGWVAYEGARPAVGRAEGCVGGGHEPACVDEAHHLSMHSSQMCYRYVYTYVLFVKHGNVHTGAIW